MELLTYSTDPGTALNRARLELWCAKEALAEANRTKDNAKKARAMGYINKDRAALAKIAKAIRAKMQPVKSYRITVAGSVTQFVKYEYAHSYQDAKQLAHENYANHFSIVSVEEVFGA